MKNRTFDEINKIYQKHVNEHKTISELSREYGFNPTYQFKKYGLEIGQTPKAGAIMVWQKGSTLSGNDGAGHVAIVEKVIDANTVYTSESSYGGSAFWNSTRIFSRASFDNLPSFNLSNPPDCVPCLKKLLKNDLLFRCISKSGVKLSSIDSPLMPSKEYGL